MWACHMCGGQRVTCWCRFSPITGSQVLNSGHQTWRQAPLPTGSSHWSKVLLLNTSYKVYSGVACSHPPSGMPFYDRNNGHATCSWL